MKLKAPPLVGDRIVIGNWHQFKSTVSCVEEMSGGRTRIHVTTEYPDDPYFKRAKESSKVWLHDEGSTWHTMNGYPQVN